VHTFQPTVEVRLADHVGLFCFHGSPRSSTDIIVSTTPDAELECMLTGYHAQVLAGGHTHTQMLRCYRDMIIVNPGSVGHTFEFTPGSPEVRIPPWTEYALVGWADDRLDIELRRVPIDVNALVRAALNSGMPHAEWWVENWG
jgi:diadenosine tetraphosphatase ApaH/serine/threonine PP2A family protein phosphatase